MLNPLKPLVFYKDEDTGGGEPDYSEYSEEELDEALSEVSETSSEEPEPETSEEEPEPAEAETSEEPSEEEPSEEPEPEKFYAGKYKSPEELERAYQEIQSLQGKQSQELAELRKFKEQAEGLIHKPPEKEETAEEDDLGLDEKELEDLFYESPVKAMTTLLKKQQEAMSERTMQEQAQKAEKEAEEFNRNIAMGRAKELLSEHAKEKELTDLQKALENEKTITLDDLEKYPEVLEQFQKEADYVLNMFQRKPIEINGKVVSNKGRLPENAFKDAYKALNYDNVIAKTKLETAEETAHAIKDAKPGAKILTPSDRSKADTKVKFTGSEGYSDAYKKAKIMDEADLDAALDELE